MKIGFKHIIGIGAVALGVAETILSIKDTMRGIEESNRLKQSYDEYIAGLGEDENAED